MKLMKEFADEFGKEINYVFKERNVNNAADNFVEELVEEALERDLKSIAVNSCSPLHEVKEIYRITLDLNRTSKIIKAATEINVNPYDVLKVLEIFKDEE